MNIHISFKKSILSLSFIMQFAHSFVGQSNSSWHQLNSSNGLSQNVNSFVHKDYLGRIWISSLDGLNIFYGRRVDVLKPDSRDSLSIFGNNIQGSFFEDAEGDIWFTTVEAINVYRQKSGKIEHYFLRTENKGSEYFAFFMEKKNFLWLIIGNALYRFNTKSTPQYSFQKISDLQAARLAADIFPDGTVKRIYACFWDYRKGFKILDFNQTGIIVKEQTFFSSIGNPAPYKLTIRQALIENDTLIWFSTDQGILAFNPEKPKNFNLYQMATITNSIRRVGFYDKNNLIVTTDKPFAYLLNKQTRKMSLYPLPKFSEFKYGAHEVFLDNFQTLWLSVYQHGLFYKKVINDFFWQPLLQNMSVTQVLDKSGEIWVLSKTGECSIKQDNNSWKKFSIPKESNLLLNGDKIWYTSPIEGFGVLNIKNLIFEKQASNLYRVSTLLRGQQIFGTNDGIYRLNENRQFTQILKLNSVVWRLKEDVNGLLWTGIIDGRVCIYKQNIEEQLELVKEFSNIGDVNAFHESQADPSVMWAATSKGLLKINKQTYGTTLISEKDGLPNQYIYAILEDKHGYLWCSTNKGLVRYHPELKTIKHYTTRDGLINSEYNPNSALLTSKGEMWFGGNNGVDAFHPDSIRDIGEAPQLAITGLKIYDKYWRGDTSIIVAQHIDLKYFENTLTFELAAMEYTDPENNKYKVMLEGYDRDWSNLGTQNFVTYVNLPAGDYVFKFKACNSEGIWNDTPRVLQITIHPPFWKTWWFIALCLFAALSLVGYIVYLRLSKVIELQKIRLKLYENLHDDIGSRLTAIVLSVDNILEQTKMKSPALQQIGDISKQIVGNMRRLVWATALENDALINVVQQMQAEKRTLLPLDIGFTIQINEALKSLVIAGDKRYQMLSIFNESLTNTHKYAEATAVNVLIEREMDDLVLTISDNGKGFDINQPRAEKANSSGYGLPNMQRRAQRIGGKLTIQSAIGKGTTIVLTFPIYDASFKQRLLVFFKKTH